MLWRASEQSHSILKLRMQKLVERDGLLQVRSLFFCVVVAIPSEADECCAGGAGVGEGARARRIC